jgi:DNA repair photolyase
MEVSILTKSHHIMRDIDILSAMRRVSVGFTITSPLDEDASILEPGATPTSRRIAALASLADAGIDTWVFIAPAFPWVVEEPETLKALADTLRDAGVSRVSVDPMNFYPGPLVRLLRTLDAERPEYARRLRRAMGNREAYAAATAEAGREIEQMLG